MPVWEPIVCERPCAPRMLPPRPGLGKLDHRIPRGNSDRGWCAAKER